MISIFVLFTVVLGFFFVYMHTDQFRFSIGSRPNYYYYCYCCWWWFRIWPSSLLLVMLMVDRRGCRLLLINTEVYQKRLRKECEMLDKLREAFG